MGDWEQTQCRPRAVSALGERMVSPQHRSDKSTAESHVMPGQLTGPGEAAGTVPSKGQALGGQGHRLAMAMTQGSASTRLHGITTIATTTLDTARDTHRSRPVPRARHTQAFESPSASLGPLWGVLLAGWGWAEEDGGVTVMAEMGPCAGRDPLGDGMSAFSHMQRKESGHEVHS